MFLNVVCWLPEKFEHMKKTGDYYVVVVEDTNLGQIVATATLITEHKFIHSCAKVNNILASYLHVFNNGCVFIIRVPISCHLWYQLVLCCLKSSIS